MPEESSIEIRPPAVDEWAACRMLLPEAFPQGARPEALVAVDHQARRITGAAAFCYGRKEILDARIRVVRVHRRKGIGTRLVQRMCALAAERSLGEIIGGSNVTVETEAEAFLLANRFTRDIRLHSVEGDLRTLRDYLGRIGDRLEKSGRIPPAARFVGLEEAPHEQVAKMYADHINEARYFHPSYMVPSLGDTRLAASTVLMADGVVRGILLCEANDGNNVATVHARVVSPGYRGGWANCLLMLRSAEQGCKAGSRRVRFDAPDDNSDTLKLMKYCRGEITRIHCWFVRDLRRRETGKHEFAP